MFSNKGDTEISFQKYVIPTFWLVKYQFREQEEFGNNLEVVENVDIFSDSVKRYITVKLYTGPDLIGSKDATFLDDHL